MLALFKYGQKKEFGVRVNPTLLYQLNDTILYLQKTSSDTTVANTWTEQPSTTATSGAATHEGNLKLTMHISWTNEFDEETGS